MMFSTISFLALVAYVAAQTAGPTIDTPAAVVQCQPVQITWSATNIPVTIRVLQSDQLTADDLEDEDNQTASPFTWRVDEPAGRNITFQIRDSTGAVSNSAPVVIQPGTDSACLDD